MRTGEDGRFQISGILRAECRFWWAAYKEIKASPSPGHADDGTWTVVIDPKAAAATSGTSSTRGGN